MGRMHIKAHMKLLKEAKKYLKEVQPLGESSLEKQKGGITLTQEHIIEWLQVFEQDRIKLDGCNFAVVKR